MNAIILLERLRGLWHSYSMAKTKETAAHKKLAAELTALIPQLDEPGLSFLIEQARVHLYNREVERLNEAQSNLAQASQRRAAAQQTAAATRSAAALRTFQIKQSAGGGCFHLCYNDCWKMYTNQEMLALVKIVQAKKTKSEIVGDMVAWLEHERPDTFQDFELGGADDPAVKELAAFLKKSFAVRKK